MKRAVIALAAILVLAGTGYAAFTAYQFRQGHFTEDQKKSAEKAVGEAMKDAFTTDLRCPKVGDTVTWKQIKALHAEGMCNGRSDGKATTNLLTGFYTCTNGDMLFIPTEDLYDTPGSVEGENGLEYGKFPHVRVPKNGKAKMEATDGTVNWYSQVPAEDDCTEAPSPDN